MDLRLLARSPGFGAPVLSGWCGLQFPLSGFNMVATQDLRPHLQVVLTGVLGPNRLPVKVVVKCYRGVIAVVNFGLKCCLPFLCHITSVVQATD
jgi:hypothetical protein